MDAATPPPTAPDNETLTRYGLGLIVMFLGGCGLVYEYVLSTLATQILGNSIEQFSLIIATMLFAMGIAGLAQKRLSTSAPLEDVFVGVELCLAVLGAASPFILYLSFAYLSHFFLVLYGLAFFVGFLIGLEIPLLVRINTRWRPALRENLGDVLSFDYVGALVGALIWAFLLLPTTSLVKISLLLASLNLGVAVLSIFLLKPWLRHRGRLWLFVLISGISIGGIHALAPSQIESARQRLYASPIRHHTQSQIQDIVTGHGQRLSLYLNGRLQFDSEDEFIYHEMLVHPAASMIKGGPADVLILGGGDGLAIREVLKWTAVKRVTLVDLDPKVIELAKSYPPLVALNRGALLDERVTSTSSVLHLGNEVTVFQANEKSIEALRDEREPVAIVEAVALDADKYLRDNEQLWDLIIADFPDPSTPDTAKLYSLEFFQLVKKALRPTGAFAIQSSSPYANRSAYWTIADTLTRAGFWIQPYHTHVPTFGEWGWHVAALDPRKIGSFPNSLRYLNEEVWYASTVFAPPIARQEGAPLVSTRLDPLILRYYLRGESLDGARMFSGDAHR